MLKKILSKQNRALLSELVRTDFKLRYQGSVLGYAWSLLRPLLLFFILYVVFVKFLRFGGDIPHYPIYLLLGIVLWTFFTEMTSLSMNSIVGRGDLIRKIRIPRWIIVLSSSLTAVINLGLNLLVVFIFMLFGGVDLLQTSLWFPLIVLEIYVGALGISLILAAGYVKYRDLSYIWEVILQGAFYLVPILYPLSIIPNEMVKKIMLLNPIAQAIQDARYSLVTHQAETIHSIFQGGYYRFIPFTITFIVLVFGVIYFRRNAKYFAENL